MMMVEIKNSNSVIVKIMPLYCIIFYEIGVEFTKDLWTCNDMSQ